MTRPRPRPARPFRLRVERLEDRATPATFNVTTTLDVIDPADSKRSLREAITSANNLAGADVIVLPAGVYKLALAGAGEDANAIGDLDITGGVTIRGAGAGLTVIDGQQLDRVFDVIGSGPSSIKGVFEELTIRNGNASGHGGGIQVGNADLVVRDCVIAGNRASQFGGGISNKASPGTGDVKVVRTTVARNVAAEDGGGLGVFGTSSLTVRDSTVRRNLAEGEGGGIKAATAALTNSTVSGNAAAGGGGIDALVAATLTNCTVSGNTAAGFGGGIFTSTATLTNCTISGNNAANGDGGGLLANTATLTNCTVNGNNATGSGGGLQAFGAVTMTRSTVSGNSSGTQGGGIDASTATLTNSTISENSAGTVGGGLHAATANLLNCTIVENLADIGGGGVNHNTGGGSLNVRNTLIALNLVGFIGSGPDVSGDFTSQGHNLIGDGTGSTGFGVNFDIVGTSANPIDPKLAPLALNGGKTRTHALLAGSPAIDRGDNANLPPTDQRGADFPRKKDGNGDGVARVDIGAFER